MTMFKMFLLLLLLLLLQLPLWRLLMLLLLLLPSAVYVNAKFETFSLLLSFSLFLSLSPRTPTLTASVHSSVRQLASLIEFERAEFVCRSIDCDGDCVCGCCDC